jgi:hypothetical protein
LHCALHCTLHCNIQARLSLKTILTWLCAVFGAAGIFVAVRYFHHPLLMEGNRVRVSAVPVIEISEIMPIAIGVPSFGSQRDLWDFAKQAEASGDAGFKYEGYIAARQCTGLIKLQDHDNKWVEAAMSAGKPGPYQALAELTRRCAGFKAVTPAESMQLVRTLKAQIAASESSFSPLVVVRELSDAERQAVLRSAAPAATELVLARIESSDEAAVLLAMCDLGKACGADSFGALLYCLDTSRCGRPLWADAADEYDPEEWQAVQLERERIVRLVKAGDLQALFKKS